MSSSGEETWDELEAQARKLGFVKDDEEDVKDDVVARLAKEAAAAGAAAQNKDMGKEAGGDKPYSPSMMPTISPEPSASPFALVSDPMDGSEQALVGDGGLKTVDVKSFSPAESALLSVPAPEGNTVNITTTQGQGVSPQNGFIHGVSPSALSTSTK